MPELGVDLIRLTRWQLVKCLALPVLAFSAYWIFAISELWVPAVLSLIVLSFATYGSTSHDLVHQSLGLSRLTNDLLLSILEAVSLRSGHAYQAAHLNHHARFPHDDDIEGRAAKMTLLQALREGMGFQVRIYVWALNHPKSKRKWIVVEGIVVLLLLASAAVATPVTVAPAVYVVLMIAGSWIIPLVTSYLTHNPHATSNLQQTRLFRGIPFRILAADHLYHLEHHLYPAVPHQNWPELANRLDPWLTQQGVEPVRWW